MFEKDQEIGGAGTVVGASVKLNGILKDLNDITVHGTVDGEVVSDKNVMISETAVVKGPVSAQIVTVSGKVNGTITANKKLEITPTGKVYGSIATKDLVIRSGAIFVGKSTMIGNDAKVESKETKKKEEKEEKKDSTFWPKSKDDNKDKPKCELEK